MGCLIYKYPLEIGSFHKIEMRKGATILHFGNQNEKPIIWAEVDPTNKKENREFLILGTGHSVPTELSLKYIGTSLFQGGLLVLHLYEIERL